MAKYSFAQISKFNKLSLDKKIKISIYQIGKALELSQSKCAIAFSGGKDSQVLWHLIKTHFPEKHKEIAVIFGNTGCEFPESLKFARKLGEEWGEGNFYETKLSEIKKDELKYQAQCEVLEWLVKEDRLSEVLKADGKLKNTNILLKKCPQDMLKDFYDRNLIWRAGSVKNILWCQDQYGYPILGKAFSKLKARRINIDCFLKYSESVSEKEELLEYYEILKSVKISQACCDVLKKEPSERLQKELKVDVIFKGLMASESRQRKINFATRGFVFKSKRAYIDTAFYHCNPISHWTDADIWEYIGKNEFEYSPLYDIEYARLDGNIATIKRNGCIGCYTDFGRKESHMYVLRQTHPKIWVWVMKNGMAKEIGKIRTYTKKFAKQSILNTAISCDREGDSHVMDWAIENRPCAFD